MPLFPEQQKEIGGRIEVLLTRAALCSEESGTLAALRDALLPKLISGELRVKDAERFVSAVA